MSTTTTESASAVSHPADTRIRRAGRPGSSRTGLRRLVFGAVILVLLGGLAVAAMSWSAIAGADNGTTMLTHTAARGALVISVTEDGNVESASNKDVKCQVSGGGMIQRIIPDGTQVKEGAEIVRIDSSALEEQVSQQRMAVEKAKATLIQAQEDFEVAKIAIQEYLEGTYEKSIQDVDAQITIAKENLRSAQDVLEHAKRMMRKGYVTPLQLEAQKFAVERANLERASAETAKTVLEKFTKVKTLKDLEAKRDAAEARLRSEKAAFGMEETKLKRLEGQLEKCVIKAPQDGMVVYANDLSVGRRGSMTGTAQIEEGASVRDQQTIIRLPDLSQMQVRVTVHETKVERIRPGMRARIVIQDRELTGTVTSVANQPEAGSWMGANVKEYAVLVKINGETNGLRPGMTAQVEILVAHLTDVLSVPVQAVVEQGGKFCAWVKGAGAPARRPLVLGMSNDKFIEITDGLGAGDQVLLNPRAQVTEAREDLPPAEPVDVQKKFGAASASAGSAPAAGRAASAGSQAKESRKADSASTTGQPARGGSTKEATGAPPGGGSPDAAPGAGGQGRGGRFGDLMQYDKDGDKKVSKSEVPEPMQGFFDRMDSNGDGFLDADELAAMRNRSRQGGGGRSFNLMQFDKDGDKKVSKAEVPEQMQGFFDRMDSNGDGFIDGDEIAAMRSRFRQGGQGGDQGGGGDAQP